MRQEASAEVRSERMPGGFRHVIKYVCSNCGNRIDVKIETTLPAVWKFFCPCGETYALTKEILN